METIIKSTLIIKEEENIDVVLIEDQTEQIDGIIKQININELKYKIINPIYDSKPNKPINGIKLLVLDLIYGSNQYDPYITVGWVIRIIPENYKYQLIVWSRHAERTQEILEKLKEENRSPSDYLQCSKQDYELWINSNFEGYNWIALLHEASKRINGFTSKLITNKVDSYSVSNYDYLPKEKYPLYTEDERRLWRTYIEIKEIDKKKETYKVLIPSWSDKELVEISQEKFPNKNKIKIDDYFFATINKETSSKEKLIFTLIELPEELQEEYGKLIHS